MANWITDYLEHNAEASRLRIARRSRHGIHLRRGGRRRLALLSGAPVHYFDSASRAWLPIDTRLQERRDGSYGAPGLPFALSADGDVRVDGLLHRQRSWRVGVLAEGRFAELARFGAARVHGDRLVRQSGVFRHETILLPGGLREELTLLEQPSLDAPAEGLLAAETLLGGRAFPEGWVGEHASESLRFPGGWAQDAAGRRAPLLRWAQAAGGAQRVYSGVPLAWLAQATYPVTLDPDIQLSGSTADGWMEGANTATSTTHDSAGANLNVGGFTFGAAPHVWRGYLKFDTSSLGIGAVVEQANLKMYPFASAGYVAWTIYARQYNWSANDPMAAATREAAWDGLLAAANAAVLATNTSGAGAHVTSQPLPTAWIQVEGNTYYGLWCNQEGYAFPNNQGGYHQYASASHATPIQRPVLLLEYLAGYPRSGPLPLRGVVPQPRVSLVDTRQKLRARRRHTALHVSMKDEG